MDAPHLTSLENAVIEAILQGLPSAKKCLTMQLRYSQLESREHNGYGFFTNLVLPDTVPVCSEANGTHAASALVGGELCGFLLWISEGKIDFLEGYPLGGDAWPKNEVIGAISLNKS